MAAGDEEKKKSFFSAVTPLGIEVAGLELIRKMIFGGGQRQAPQVPRGEPYYGGVPPAIQPTLRYNTIAPQGGGVTPQELANPPAVLPPVPQNIPYTLPPGAHPQMRFSGNDRDDLLRDINDTIYGGGQQPIPTPTPTPTPRFYVT